MTTKRKQRKSKKPKKTEAESAEPSEESGNARTTEQALETRVQPSNNSFAQFLEESKKKQSGQADLTAPPPDASTLTGSERKVFEKLYRAQEREAEKAKTTTISDDDLLDRMRPPDGIEEDGLDKIFDEVIEKERAHELAKAQQERAEAVQQKEHASLRKSFPAEFHGVKRVDFKKARDQPPQSAIEKAAQDNFYRIKRLFARVQEDFDLWRVLEVEVFSKMRAANKYLEALEEAKMGASGLTSRKKGRRKTRTEAESLKALPAPPGHPPTTPLGSSTSNNSQVSDPVTAQPNPMQLLTPIYGPTLLQAAYMYRTLFPRSPYAMALLPKIKEYGPISYVLGASTALYNETLYLKWKYYRDLDGCGQLVEEMVAKGLKIDRRTLGVMQDALNTKKREQTEGMLELKAITERTSGRTAEGRLSGQLALQLESTDSAVTELNVKNGPELPTLGTQNREAAQKGMLVGSLSAGWWRLQGNRAGWQRWRDAHEEAMQRWKEDLLRVEEEKRSAEEEKVGKIETPETEGDYAEPDIAVLDPDAGVGVMEEVNKLAVGGAG